MAGRLEIFLDGAANTLQRASGLSLSMTKAANSLLADAEQENLFSFTVAFKASTVDEASQLRRKAIRLYNVLRKGSTREASIVQLQLLACYVMASSRGATSVNENPAVFDLDLMRCFSRVGHMLIQVDKRAIGRDALIRCIELGGEDPLNLILNIFGTQQDAHSSGSSFFMALCDLFALELDECLQQGYSEPSLLKLDSALETLRNHTNFIANAQISSQNYLRDLLNRGIELLGASQSIPIQHWMFEAWEDFASSNAESNKCVAARLAYSLAISRDNLAAVTALERASTIFVDEVSEKLSTKAWFYIAKVAVRIRTFDDERKIREAMNSEMGNALLVLDIATETRFEEAKRECLESMNEFCAFLNTHSDVLLKEPYVAVDALGNLAMELFNVFGSMENSFGLALKSAQPDVNALCRVLRFGIKQLGSSFLIFMRSKANQSVMDQLKSHRCDSSVQTLCATLWNSLCEHQAKGEWQMVYDSARTLQLLAKPPLTYKAKLAELIATFHVTFPNKDGECEGEARTLEHIILAIEDARSESSENEQTLISIKLRATMRLIILTVPGYTLDSFREMCSYALTQAQLSPAFLIPLADEAKNLGGVNIAIACLEEVKSAYERGDDIENLQAYMSVLDRLVLAHIFESGLETAVEEIDNWFSRIESTALTKMALENPATSDFRNKLVNHIVSAMPNLDALERVDDAINASKSLIKCARLSDEATKTAFYSAAISLQVRVCTRACLSKPSNCDRGLIATVGNEVNALINNLTQTSCSTMHSLSTASILSVIFMGAETPEIDSIIAERVAGTCDDGKMAFPPRHGLEIAADVARKLDLKQTARILTIRIVQYELGLESPDYERVIRRCFTRLLANATCEAEVREWASQIDNIVRGNCVLSATALAKIGLAVWKKRSLFHQQSAAAMVVEPWLTKACEKDPSVQHQLQAEITAIRNMASSRVHD